MIDEIPNAILSGAAGALLKEYLGHVKGRKTVIIITYRDDYMAMADTVLEFSRSEPVRIVERDHKKPTEKAA